VKSILNYREKGGRFKKQADLGKIYTLSQRDFERIAPYALFEAGSGAPLPVAMAAGVSGAKRPAEHTALVDINRASMEAWATLPGIGEARARQLVNFREKLGGFLRVEQVGEMYGLPDSVFQRIRPRLAFSTPSLRKVNLNTATVADLDAHPYISKKQAQLIVAYREQHGDFAAPEGVAKILAFTDKVWLEKVMPYLGVE
jgi:competence protein ComEA